MGKPDPLCLLNLCGIVGVVLPARNKGMGGTLPSTLATGATYRHGMGEGSSSHSSILHRPMDGQLQLLEGAEEDQIEQQVIWTYWSYSL